MFTAISLFAHNGSKQTTRTRRTSRVNERRPRPARTVRFPLRSDIRLNVRRILTQNRNLAVELLLSCTVYTVPSPGDIRRTFKRPDKRHRWSRGSLVVTTESDKLEYTGACNTSVSGGRSTIRFWKTAMDVAFWETTVGPLLFVFHANR